MTCCYGLASVVVCRLSCVNILFLRTTGPILTNLVCSICRVRRQEIVIFKNPTPRLGNLEVKSVKLIYLFKKFSSLLLGTVQKKNKCIGMMTNEGSTNLYSINIKHIDCYCIKVLYCLLPPLLDFMIGLHSNMSPSYRKSLILR